MAKRLVIVGGGIAGLSAAYYALKKSQKDLEITILEKSSSWGGKITTDRLDGFVIEGGPDTFLATKPWAVDLCRDLGLDGRLRGTNPTQKNTYILKKGVLHPLPGGLTMMIPTDVMAMLRTGLLSWSAKARMGLDYFIPTASDNGDESLGAFVSRRLGREAYENLVEPLMSGIYAGDGDLLSLQATFPYLRDLELRHGSLIKGALHLRRERARKSGQAAPGSRSMFLTPETGLMEIVEALVSHLAQHGVRLRDATQVESLEKAGDSFTLHLPGGERLTAGGVILATPAFVSGKLLAGLNPGLGTELESIPYVSTATVSLGYKASDLPRPLDGYGYVIPRRENHLALACTWSSTKFPHRAPENFALLRVFIGRAGQEGQIPWEEEGLLQIARDELAQTLGLHAAPVLSRVYMWERAMPQYNLGHLEKVGRIEKMVAAIPGLSLAGNAYHGIGIPDCIHSGELAAEQVVAGLLAASAGRQEIKPAVVVRYPRWTSR